MITIREADIPDAEGISEVFHGCYGDHYAHPQFFDPHFLIKHICNENTIVLVAEDTDSGRVAGTASVLMDHTGAYADMLGELGRLAVHPDFRNHGIGKLLLEGRLAHVKDRLQVGIMDARVTHPFTQKIAEKHDFAVVGFLPQKFNFGKRESVLQMVHFFGQAMALRKNHPLLIPEVMPLASLAMSNCGMAVDAQVVDGVEPYPCCETYELEEMTTEGYCSLIRIERGRLSHREVFGPVQLQYGYFKIQANQAHYYVARENGQLVGAIGFILDDFEKTIRIFELITFDDRAIRFLLEHLIDHAMTKYGTCYMEIDVSAYAPRMQRTVYDYGFYPAAYHPSLVFHQTERLDIVKMVKLLVPLELGELILTPNSQPIADVVIRQFQGQHVLPEIHRAVTELSLFSGLNTEQCTKVAGLFTSATYQASDVIFKEGDESASLLVLISGAVDVKVFDGQELTGRVLAGECLGEVSLLTGAPHFAKATATEATECAVLSHRELAELIRQRPDIGLLIYKNLAKGLGQKLKRSDFVGV